MTTFFFFRLVAFLCSIMAGAWAFYSFRGQFPNIVVSNPSFPFSSCNKTITSLELRFNITNLASRGISFKSLLLSCPPYFSYETTEVFRYHPNHISYLPPHEEMTLSIKINALAGINNNRQALAKTNKYNLVLDSTFCFFFKPKATFMATLA
ncbi:MAG: hypothetical protein KKC80_03300 [Candidatus Margulisbacteria bacterium]|nr:hypothetical protein [Candidatus Margulisiibacteriota bacterium]MBU1616678.1 hypothetical protein [Candidatus Margulisiibacteriota bacterium]